MLDYGQRTGVVYPITYKFLLNRLFGALSIIPCGMSHRGPVQVRAIHAFSDVMKYLGSPPSKYATQSPKTVILIYFERFTTIISFTGFIFTVVSRSLGFVRGAERGGLGGLTPTHL